ncbi:MAG: hypothetical protein LBE18_06745 [Planctomycetaceae bacterium]|jgi:hypothetical protein|nr:hypothetical protein [Planctomycetaceae bacterium]
MNRKSFSILLIVVILAIGFCILVVRNQVLGQQPLLMNNAEQPNQYQHYQPRQVTVKPQPEPPKWLVEFTPINDPANQTNKIMAITIVDPESKRILIYHANLSYGALKFISSRDIMPDITLGEYNAVSPTPREIIAEIERLKNNKQ